MCLLVVQPPLGAAEVILASVNPDTLSPEDREKLDLMVSA